MLGALVYQSRERQNPGCTAATRLGRSDGQYQDMSGSSNRRVAAFAWLVLVYNLGVILWGAYVRATGSGAGCGDHWPLCNGVVIPRDASTATLIEFSHRLTSGLALISVVALLVGVRRVCPPGHPARRGAGWTVFFMLTEAAVGAGLVLFQLVADDASTARAMFMAVHLVNTFILVAWLSLTAWWLSGGAGLTLRDRAGSAIALGGLSFALLLVGVSGAIAALGDTLFPQGSVAEALAADLSPTSHLFIRLRILHPTLAALTALILVVLPGRLARHHGWGARMLATTVASLATVQVLLGLLNVALLAPVWMQLVHLLAADLLWIAFVLFGAQVLSVPAAQGNAISARASSPTAVRTT